MPGEPHPLQERWLLRTPSIAGRALYGNVPVPVFIVLTLAGLMLFAALREAMGALPAAVLAVLLAMAAHEAVRAVTLKDRDWLDVRRERLFIRARLRLINHWRRQAFRWPE
jgi:hypothetical protein